MSFIYAIFCPWGDDLGPNHYPFWGVRGGGLGAKKPLQHKGFLGT